MYLAKGCVDIAVTYSRAAEQHSLDTGAAIYRMYGFRVGDAAIFSFSLCAKYRSGPLLPRRTKIQSSLPKEGG